MTRRKPTPAAIRAILTKRWNPAPGQEPTDRRTYAQLRGGTPYHHEAGTPYPADELRAWRAAQAERAARGATTPQEPPEDPEPGTDASPD